MNEYKKINQANASILNRLKVLRIIKENKFIKRDKIANLTGLQKSTLTYIMTDLKKFNLIKEEKIHESNKVGVPPLTVSINQDDNFVIGIDVELDYIKAVAMNFNYDIVFSHEFTVDITERSFEKYITEVVKYIKNKINKKFLNICIGMPGVVDTSLNKILVSNLLNIKNFSLSKDFIKSLKSPIFLENNSNAAAYGEYILKYKDKTSNLYYLFFHLTTAHGTKNTGIGSSIIIDSKIYYGNSYAAGEIGDIIESIVQQNFTKYTYTDFLKNFADILNLADGKSNERYRKIIKKFGYELGRQIGNFINILNTEIVIIGGDYPLDTAGFNSYIISGIKDNIIDFLKDKVKIKTGGGDGYSVARGAAIIAVDKILTYEYLKKILRR